MPNNDYRPKYQIVVSQELKNVVSDAHFKTMERIASSIIFLKYVRKRNYQIEKYQNLTKGNKTLQ